MARVMGVVRLLETLRRVKRGKARADRSGLCHLVSLTHWNRRDDT